MPAKLDLASSPLQVPFRQVFSHANARFEQGVSIWVEATRNGNSGVGEGCPRVYVTGETIDTCQSWINEHVAEITRECADLDGLTRWSTANAAEIDCAPSAWCAVECALLDLFAREQGVSVEALLGLGDPRRVYTYTGVLSDAAPKRFSSLVEAFLAMGITDYKVKLGGDLAADRVKLELLHSMCAAAGVTPRVRIDANNLWREKPNEAGRDLAELRTMFFACEEPLASGDFDRLATLSDTLERAMILDESVRRVADLDQFTFNRAPIVNVKVSKAGGVMRARELVRTAAGRGLNVIIGAFVGETSVLTRAGMLMAQVAGDSLVGHEGGAGVLLLAHEPVSPSLTLGKGGCIDLASPQHTGRPGEHETVSPETWSMGWGLTRTENAQL